LNKGSFGVATATDRGDERLRGAIYRPSGESVTQIASHGAFGGWFRVNRPVALRAVLPVGE
jgi:hypothetical protein